MRPDAPVRPRGPLAPCSAAIALPLRSDFWSDPLMTCAEPTLFLGSSFPEAA